MVLQVPPLPVADPYISSTELQITNIKNILKPKIVHKIKPMLKNTSAFIQYLIHHRLQQLKGVIAREKPIPKENAIKTKLFPSDTAARGAAPSLPTIILSAKPTKT